MIFGLAHPVAPNRRTALLMGLGAAALLIVLGVFRPAVALRGWLVGFAAAGSIPLGALAWLAIHGLTGGRWGDVARPALLRAASSLPLLLLLWLPLLVGAHTLYPWPADPVAAPRGVAALYLNVIFFALRSFIVLGALFCFGLLARRKPFGFVPAALCLLIYAIGMNLLAFDWLLSLDPHYNSSAFGVQFIITQLAAALAFVLLVTDAPSQDTAWGDFGALLLATLLGLLYLVYMTFLVDWYGDLPAQAAWYLIRSRHGWSALEISGLVVGAVLPLLALLFDAVRHSPARLRLVALTAGWGVIAEMLWLAAPSAGSAAAPAGCLGCLAVGGLLAGFAYPRWGGGPREARKIVADGH